MAKIIERGKLNVGKCKYCGCIFSYEKEEVTKIETNYGELVHDAYTIECPQCELDTPIFRGSENE